MCQHNGEQNLNKEHLESQLDRHLEWIKACDTKSSIILGAIGVFLSLFGSQYFFDFLVILFSNGWFLGLFLISAAAFTYGLYSLIRVLIPSLRKTANKYNEVDVDNSLYFFGSISRLTFENYKNKAHHRTLETEIDDLLTQIYVNARVANDKYRHYQHGVISSSIGIALIVIFYIVGLVLIANGWF